MKCPTCQREGYTPKGVYPCGEHPYHSTDIRHLDVCRNGFMKTGEKRPPRKDEWYLSGAIPAAYRARADLDTAYLIMRPFNPTHQLSDSLTPAEHVEYDRLRAKVKKGKGTAAEILRYQHLGERLDSYSTGEL